MTAYDTPTRGMCVAVVNALGSLHTYLDYIEFRYEISTGLIFVFYENLINSCLTMKCKDYIIVNVIYYKSRTYYSDKI